MRNNRLRKWLWLLSLQCGVTASVVPAVPAVEPSSVDQSVDFGIVDNGKDVNHKFVIENPSDRVVHISKARVSCGCLKIIKCPKSIEPGGREQVDIVLSTTGKRGAIRMNAYLETDDPTRQLIALEVRALCRAVWVEPSILVFSNAMVTGGKAQRFFVIESGLPDLKITKVNCDNKSVKLEVAECETVKEMATANWRAVKVVTVTCQAESVPIGRSSATISVATDNQDFQTLQVPVQVERTSIGTTSTSQVYFGLVRLGATVEREVTIHLPDRYKAGIEGIEVKATDECISASLQQVTTGNNEIKLRVICAAPDDSMAGRRLLKGEIRGSNSEDDLFSIPYVAILSAN